MIYGSYPKRVHIEDDIHYFYWDWDFYKPFDYEPIQIHDSTSGKTLLSRFHWHVATIWTEPILQEDGKPEVAFTTGIHTPIVRSSSLDYRYVEIEPDLSFRERFEIVTLYLPMFERILRGEKFTDAKNGYDKIIVEGGVPGDYIFDLCEIKCAVLIGRFPRPDDLPNLLKEKIWPEEEKNE